MKVEYDDYGDYKIQGTLYDDGRLELEAIINGESVLTANSYRQLIEKIDAREKRLEQKKLKGKDFQRLKAVVFERGGAIEYEITSFTEDGEAWVTSQDKKNTRYNSSGREKINSYKMEYFYPVEGNEAAIQKIQDYLLQIKVLEKKIADEKETMKTLQTVAMEWLKG